jgi:ATP-dependent protease HslVU (ClpYQ) peptidase subunit
MDTQLIINFVLGSIASVTGWFARELWAAVQQLKEDLYKLREELAKDYMPKEEFIAFKGELFTLLHRIEDKIEKKEDK